MALKLIAQAFRLIFGNFGPALRVSIGPFTLAVATLLLIRTEFIASMMKDAAAIIVLPFVLLLILMAAFIPAWMAVSWHRFVLLEDRLGLIPRVAGRPIWPYIAKTLILGILTWLIGVLSFSIVSLLNIAVNGSSLQDLTLATLLQGPSMIIILGTQIVNVLLAYVVQRLAVVLPATAVGQPIGFGAAWKATGRASGAIFGVALFFVVLNAVPELLLSSVFNAVPLLGTAVGYALSWLTFMLGVSILTVLYGHLVEGRPLPT